MEVKSSRPFVLTIDDDPEVNKLMAHRLASQGWDVKTTESPEEFIRELKGREPNLCLIDLDLDRPSVGYRLIEAIRSAYSAELPILIMSRHASQAKLRHAMEVGATDYIIKPAAKDYFLTVLAKYIETAGHHHFVSEFGTVPKTDANARLTFDVTLKAVRERGLILLSPNAIARGTAIWVECQMMNEITGRTTPLLVTVSDSSGEETLPGQPSMRRIEVEFDPYDEPLRTSVRKWLLLRRFTEGQAALDSPSAETQE